MKRPSPPALSALLITAGTGARLCKTINHLGAQTVCNQIELVLICPQQAQLGLTSAELAPFHAVRYVELGTNFTTAYAYAAGVHAASAPIVVSCEDHSYPQPGWAEALLAAHRDGWRVVGPMVRNDNPETLVSWADMFICFGEWVEPAPSGGRDHVPQHNSSYRRDLLLGFGAQLPVIFAVERLLQDALRAKGHRIYLEPEAITAHTNFSSLRVWMTKQYFAGRNFGARRSQGWKRLRRWLYVAGGPLIPIVQLRRALREVRQPGRFPATAGSVARLTPVLLCGLTAHTAGEMAGYAFGLGTAEQELSRFELDQTKRG